MAIRIVQSISNFQLQYSTFNIQLPTFANKKIKDSLNILQLSKKFPFPPKDGESIAICNLARAMHQLGHQISLLSMNTTKHFVKDAVPTKGFDFYKRVDSVEVDSSIKVVDAFINLFSNKSYHIERFISSAYTEKLKKILQDGDFDVVQLETLYLAPYIPIIRKYSNAIIAMRAHNVEHEIWDRIASNTSFLPKRFYLNHLVKKLHRFEKDQLSLYDILLPITQRDAAYFKDLGYAGRVEVVPIGIDSQLYKPDYDSFNQNTSVSFIGSLDWMPNQEGLQWFLNNVWPEVIRKMPDLNLYIAGRNPPSWIQHLSNQNIQVLGEVEDAAAFINQHPLTLVPLLSGSGMRVKILEGMALGRVVITTSMGLEGIPAEHKKEVLVADTVDAFVQAFDYCIKNQSSLKQFGERAQNFIKANYDNLRITRSLTETYKTMRVAT